MRKINSLHHKFKVIHKNTKAPISGGFQYPERDLNLFDFIIIIYMIINIIQFGNFEI